VATVGLKVHLVREITPAAIDRGVYGSVFIYLYDILHAAWAD
jgi:hypothetical protein